jgi:hypothetical protein
MKLTERPWETEPLLTLAREAHPSSTDVQFLASRPVFLALTRIPGAPVWYADCHNTSGSRANRAFHEFFGIKMQFPPDRIIL